MLEIVKNSLKISTNIFDSDLRRMIEACKLDLSMSGIKKIDEQNALIQQAIILYCKVNFERKPDADTDRLEKAYRNLKIAISLCGDYT